MREMLSGVILLLKLIILRLVFEQKLSFIINYYR